MLSAADTVKAMELQQIMHRLLAKNEGHWAKGQSNAQTTEQRQLQEVGISATIEVEPEGMSYNE